MNLKRYNRYQIDLTGKWANASLVCMGTSVFLLMLRYFGLTNLADLGFGSVLFLVVLPLMLGIGQLVILRLLRWDAPGIHAILAAVLCLLLMVGTFFTGSPLRILLGILWYGLSAVTILACAGGYLPGRLPAALMLWIAGFVRLAAFDLGALRLTGWIGELSVLLALSAYACLIMAMQPVKSHT